MYNNGKKKICSQSTTEDRQKSNPYHPLSYREYCDMALIAAYELNELIRGIPHEMIPDFWLISSEFRGRFKRLMFIAAFIHYEETIQKLLPWCNVNLMEYCDRFSENGYNITKKYSPCNVKKRTPAK